MEAHVDLTVFRQALIVLAAAGVVIPLFYRLRVSPVLGYMLVGMAVGPFGLGRAVAALPWLGAVTFGHAAFQPVIELIISLAELCAKEPWALAEVSEEHKLLAKRVDELARAGQHQQDADRLFQPRELPAQTARQP